MFFMNNIAYLKKAIYFSCLGPELFLSVAWPTGVQLLVFI